MSVIANMPDLRPSMLLDFANAARVHPLITCVRPSTATCWGPDGRLRTVAQHVPRIDYDSGSGKCLGLLAEGADTNIAKYSGDIANSVWQQVSATVVNGPVSLDGVTLSRGVVPNSVYGVHAVLCDALTAPLLAGQTVVYSAMLRRGACSYAALRVRDANGWSATAYFDLITGATNQIGGGVLRIEQSSQRLRDDWWRCVMRCTSTAEAGSSTARTYIYPAQSMTGVSFAGDDMPGIYVGGVQITRSAAPSSYISTTSAAVTRAADAIKLQPKARTSGTFFIEHDGATGLPLLSDAARTILASQGPGRIAIAFNSNEIRVCVNGGAISGNDAISMGSELQIGGQGSLHIARIAEYSSVLSNEQLRRITA